MANMNKESKEDQVWSAQRRRMFGWLGKVALGVSVAGIGLEALSPQGVRAATAHTASANSTLLRTQRAAQAASDGALQPDCIPCPTGCEVVSCYLDSEFCDANPPYITILYYYDGGCVALGQQCSYGTDYYCGHSCLTSC